MNKDITEDILLKAGFTKIEDRLERAMSYCNAKTLDEFIGKPQCILLSNNAQNAINK